MNVDAKQHFSGTENIADKGVSRRTVLIAGGIAAFALPSIQATGAVAAPPRSHPATAIKNAYDMDTSAASSFFSAGWTQRVSAYFPHRLDIPSTGKTSQVDLTWDPRVFALDSSAVVRSGEEVEIIELGLQQPGHLAVSLPAMVESIMFVPRSIVQYPNDLVEQPIATRARISDRSSAQDLDFALVVEPARPWSLELHASWLTSVGQGFPSMLQMKSAGPNPIPATVSLAVLIGTDVSRSLSIQELPGELGVPDRRHDGTQTKFVFGLSTPLQPDESLQVDLSAASEERKLPLDQTFPSVRASIPSEEMVNVRATNRLEIAPITSSGSTTSDYAPAKKA